MKHEDNITFLNEIMERYGNDVWNMAFSLTHKTELADDITQEVFIKAFKKIETFRHEAAIKTWILQIARNTTYDYLRSSFFRKVTLVGTLLDKGVHPSAEQEAFENIVRNDIWKIVLNLPLKYREILILYGHHQLAISEIAELLRISESTAKTRLNRARKRALNLLEEVEQDGKK